MALDGRNIAVLVLSWCLLKLIYVLCITFTVSIILYFQYFPNFSCLNFYPDLRTVSNFVVTILMFFWSFVSWSFKIIVHIHLGVHKIIWLFGSLLTVFFIVCCYRCLLLVSLGIQLVVTQCHCVLCVTIGVLFWLDRFCVYILHIILHKPWQCALKNYSDLHSMWLVALCSVLCLFIILLDGMCFVIKYLSFAFCSEEFLRLA